MPQHVLRFWETKFSQLRPLKRAGGRRYYRPEDVAFLHRIRDLLYRDGFTIKGVQRLLRQVGGRNGLMALLEEHERTGAALPVLAPPPDDASAEEEEVPPAQTPQPHPQRPHPQPRQRPAPTVGQGETSSSACASHAPAPSWATEAPSPTAPPLPSVGLSPAWVEALESVLEELLELREEMEALSQDSPLSAHREKHSDSAE